MIPEVSFVINCWILLKYSELLFTSANKRSSQCCGETEISTEVLGVGRPLVGDSAVFETCLM